MFRLARLLPVIALLALLSNPLRAQTVTRHLGINPYASDIGQHGIPGPGASFGPLFRGAIKMPDPDTGLSRLTFGFTLPDDYAPGTPFYLLVMWNSDAISCVVDLRNDGLLVAQPDQALVENGGMEAESVMLAPNDSKVSQQTRFLFWFPPATPSFAPGASVIGGLHRDPTLDSCSGDLLIQGFSIEYQALLSAVFRDGFEVTDMGLLDIDEARSLA